MRCGKLRHKLALKRPATTVGSLGQRSGSETTLAATWWGEVTTLRGREAEQARKTFATAQVQIRIRAFDGLTTKDKVVFGSREFEIGHINDVREIGHEMILLCTEDK